MLKWIVWNRTVLRLNCVLMLNWVVWNRTVFIFKQCTHAKLNCLKMDQLELMLNWSFWNRTVYMYKNGFGIKQPTLVDIL